MVYGTGGHYSQPSFSFISQSWTYGAQGTHTAVMTDVGNFDANDSFHGQPHGTILSDQDADYVQSATVKYRYWDPESDTWGSEQERTVTYTPVHSHPPVDSYQYPERPAPPAENSDSGSLLDKFQTALDIIGLFDPTPLSDGLNAAIHLARGNYAQAALSAVSMIPYAGDALGKGGKLLLRAGEAVGATRTMAKIADTASSIANVGGKVVDKVCPVLTPAIRVGGAALGGKSIADGIEKFAEGDYYGGFADVLSGITSVRGSLKASFCFVGGTQVVVGQHYGEVLASDEAGDPLLAVAEPSPEHRELWAAIFVGAGLVGWQAAERRKRREQHEAERDRALWAALLEEDGDEPPDPRFEPETDSDEEDWSMHEMEPDWDDRIDEVCEALFRGDAHCLSAMHSIAPPHFSGSRAQPARLGRSAPPAAVGSRASALDSPEETRDACILENRPIMISRTQQSPTPSRGSSTTPATPRRRSRFGLAWLLGCLALAAFLGFGKSGSSPLPSASQVPASKVAAAPAPRYRTKNIEDIKIGDYVESMDPETGERSLKQVKDVFRRVSSHLRVLGFVGGAGQSQELKTTDEHPFWVVDSQEFAPASDLTIGQRVLGPSGELQLVAYTHREEHPEGVPVYNFEVDDFHTYFATALGARAPPVFVHNACQAYNQQPRPRPPGQQAHHIIQDGRAKGLTSANINYHYRDAPTELVVGAAKARNTEHYDLSQAQTKVNQFLRSRGITSINYEQARAAAIYEMKQAGWSQSKIQDALKSADNYFINTLGINPRAKVFDVPTQ